MTVSKQPQLLTQEQLIHEQRPILGSVLIIIVTALLVALMPSVSAEEPILAGFFLPAFIAGGLGKFVGRFVQMYLRVIAGLIVFVLVLHAVYANISLTMALTTATLNGLVCWAVAVRHLPRKEKTLA